eukprot:GHVP01006104.1.p3 GENE.GHVP01006104.1~~GHVP01006104.1.p3  ORF type:complete len:140 (+),score=12.54 GHVP01006104.1:306-725(+)
MFLDAMWTIIEGESDYAMERYCVEEASAAPPTIITLDELFGSYRRLVPSLVKDGQWKLFPMSRQDLLDISVMVDQLRRANRTELEEDAEPENFRFPLPKPSRAHDRTRSELWTRPIPLVILVRSRVPKFRGPELLLLLC